MKNPLSRTHRIGAACTLIIMVMVGTLQADDDSHNGMCTQWQRMHDSKAAALEEFNEAKFGMFIHWGVYARLGGVWKCERMEDGGRGPRVAEWIMRRKEIPRSEYAKVAGEFNPIRFDADEWARLAADAGMRYMVITSKHHDGFALFDSKHSEWDIMDAAPLRRDVIRELHDACAKKGIRFGVYYSHGLDWFDGGDGGRQYAEGELKGLRGTAINTWDPSPRSFDEYMNAKALPQVAELTEKYPDLFLIWFDFAGYLPPARSFDFYKLIYSNAPDILVNSRISNDRDLTRLLGDYESAGDNHVPTKEEIGSAYWETCGTMNNSWGYKSYDDDWKSPVEVLSWLLDVVSRGGNYLLNVGPDGRGEIPAESVEILREVGQWLEVNGEAVYGTRAWTTFREGPTEVSRKGTGHREKEGFNATFTPQDLWFTQKDDSVYVIALVWPENSEVLVRSMKQLPVKRVRLLGSGETVSWKTTAGGLKVTLPGEPVSPHGFALEVLTEK